MLEFDPATIAEFGIGVVAIIVLYLLVMGFIKVWEKSIEAQHKSIEAQNSSTDALNRNTVAYTQLSSIFEKSHEREMEFQRETKEFHSDALWLLRDTHTKVDYLHTKQIKEE